MSDPVLRDTRAHYREMDKAAAFDAAVSQREAEIWQDDETLSEMLTDLDCLEVRGVRRGPGYWHKAVNTGRAAIAAIRGEDAIELMRLIRAELAAKVRQRAIDDVEERDDH